MSVCKMLTTPHAYSQSPLFHHCLKDNVCPWNQGHCNWGTCASHVHWKIRRTAKPNRNGQQKWKEIVFIVCVKVDLNHFTMYLANHRLLLKAVSGIRYTWRYTWLGKPARLTIRVLLVLVSDLSNSSKTNQILRRQCCLYNIHGFWAYSETVYSVCCKIKLRQLKISMQSVFKAEQ